MEVLVVLSNKNLKAELYLEDKVGFLQGTFIDFNKINLDNKVILVEPFKNALSEVSEQVQKIRYLSELSCSSFSPREKVIDLLKTGRDSLCYLIDLEVISSNGNFSLYGRFKFRTDYGFLIYNLCLNRIFLFSKVTLLGEFVGNEFYTSEIIGIDLFVDSLPMKSNPELEFNVEGKRK